MWHHYLLDRDSWRLPCQAWEGERANVRFMTCSRPSMSGKHHVQGQNNSPHRGPNKAVYGKPARAHERVMDLLRLGLEGTATPDWRQF